MKNNSEIPFPVISKNTKMFYPSSRVCPICNTDRHSSNSGFYVLNAGALEEVSQETLMMSDKLKGFLKLAYHPSEDSDENGFCIDIVKDSECGQFDIYFCSTNCMRIFFNKIIDTIENKKNKHKI